nr:MAG TPA: hypothetical protein [Caudoviricetes sp.]
MFSLLLIKCLLFAVPLQLLASLFLRISSLRHSIAELVNASPLLLVSTQCLRPDQPRNALPLLRKTSLYLALPLPCLSVLLSAAAMLCALPLHSSSPHSLCQASRRVATPLRIRAVNAMPLLSGLHLISGVGKAALSAVAPLADAAQNAIIQPLTHNLFVAVVKEDYVKLAGATRRDLLTVGKAHALALCGLSTQRTLAVGNLTVHVNGNHAGLNENQAVNDPLVSSQLAAFIHGLLLASLGLAADAGKHTASILKHAFDLVIVKNRIAVRVTRENGHALVSYRIRAKSRDFILDGCSIRRLAGDKLAGHIGVCGPCTQHRLNKRSFHMQFFHLDNLQNKFVSLRHAVVLGLAVVLAHRSHAHAHPEQGLLVARIQRIKQLVYQGVRSVGPVNGDAVPLCSQIGAVLLCLCHKINSFCGWHPRPCPAGCRVVSTLAAGSSSGGLCPEIKIGQNILPILRCIRKGITRTIVPAKHFTKVIHPARNACACILFENFHRSDLLKHLHASHGVVSRRAHITVRKINDRVPCAILVDLQCITMRLGFRAVNPLARPAASLPSEPVVTPCGYNITNAVRISYFPDAPAPSCVLVNVHRSALPYSLTSHTSVTS